MTAEYVIGKLGDGTFIVAKFLGGDTPAATYHVRPGRTPSCDCAYVLEGHNPECKHLHMVKAQGLLDELNGGSDGKA